MKILVTHTTCLNTGAKSIRPQQVELSQEPAEFGSKIHKNKRALQTLCGLSFFTVESSQDI